MVPLKKQMVSVDGILIKDAVCAIEGYAVLIKRRHPSFEIKHYCDGILKKCELLKDVVGPIECEKE